MMGALKDAFELFPKRWRFVAVLHGPCTLYRWVARSPDALVGESVECEQWPEMRLQAGSNVFECKGPDDLMLVARVRLDDGKFSVIAFTREELTK